MTTANEIPLTPDNQNFSITLAGTIYQLRIIWREVFWYLDLLDSSGSPIVTGMPLQVGADLLAQYASLGFNFSLYVVCDDPQQDAPLKSDLGIYSHLIVVTG
ncbi:phage baseplate plug family protein [Yokenella regensburgei]|uniref:phage baseplate plug family protein n=1 Tax=Yokenella regensburgei TaxID=158877 RepID=UPI001375D26A|nr:hypothetical protein [Yokenella regensburgei]KAF1368534.1 hypothetical protein FHR25_002739 [Yokenella regensburgei]